MDDQQATPETPSSGTRITNVFASPGEAFDGLGTLESKTTLWLIPMLVAMTLAVLASFVISSNETLKGQIVEMQARAMQERVEKGSMTQEQADQATEQMQGMGTLFAVFGAVAGVVGTALLYFVGTLFLWLIGKFALKAAHGYSTYLALYGISSWIAVLGSVMTVLMMVGLNSMYATPSAALAVYADFDSLDTTHRLLSKLGLFSIWQAVVIGIGLSKVSGKPTGIGIGFSFGLLALWIALSMWVGF